MTIRLAQWGPGSQGFIARLYDGTSHWCPVLSPGDPSTIVSWHPALADVQAFLSAGGVVLEATVIDTSKEAQIAAIKQKLGELDISSLTSRGIRDLMLSIPSFAANPSVAKIQAIEAQAILLRQQLTQLGG